MALWLSQAGVLFLLLSCSGFLLVPHAPPACSLECEGWESVLLFSVRRMHVGTCTAFLFFKGIFSYCLFSDSTLVGFKRKQDDILWEELTKRLGWEGKSQLRAQWAWICVFASFCFIANQWHYLSGLLPLQLQNKALLGLKTAFQACGGDQMRKGTGSA